MVDKEIFDYFEKNFLDKLEIFKLKYPDPEYRLIGFCNDHYIKNIKYDIYTNQSEVNIIDTLFDCSIDLNNTECLKRKIFTPIYFYTSNISDCIYSIEGILKKYDNKHRFYFGYIKDILTIFDNKMREKVNADYDKYIYKLNNKYSYNSLYNKFCLIRDLEITASKIYRENYNKINYIHYHITEYIPKICKLLKDIVFDIDQYIKSNNLEVSDSEYFDIMNNFASLETELEILVTKSKPHLDQIIEMFKNLYDYKISDNALMIYMKNICYNSEYHNPDVSLEDDPYDSPDYHHLYDSAEFFKRRRYMKRY